MLYALLHSVVFTVTLPVFLFYLQLTYCDCKQIHIKMDHDRLLCLCKQLNLNIFRIKKVFHICLPESYTNLFFHFTQVIFIDFHWFS